MPFRTDLNRSPQGTVWATDKTVPQDTMDAARLIMTTVVLNVRETCLETSPIGLGMRRRAVGLAAGAQLPLIWTGTAVILNGRAPGKYGKMTEDDHFRETLVKVPGALRSGMNLPLAAGLLTPPTIVSAADLRTISRASLEMDATGSLDRCLRLLQDRTNIPSVRAGLANADPPVNFPIDPLAPVIAVA
ncbi:hypothetical protein BFW01_g2090 [Lasiodiplodia theobromae]|nr:hypothetical protein BFW01_g2090 [Lasiodiplodia theobromae]